MRQLDFATGLPNNAYSKKVAGRKSTMVSHSHLVVRKGKQIESLTKYACYVFGRRSPVQTKYWKCTVVACKRVDIL